MDHLPISFSSVFSNSDFKWTHLLRNHNTMLRRRRLWLKKVPFFSTPPFFFLTLFFLEIKNRQGQLLACLCFAARRCCHDSHSTYQAAVEGCFFYSAVNNPENRQFLKSWWRLTSKSTIIIGEKTLHIKKYTKGSEKGRRMGSSCNRTSISTYKEVKYQIGGGCRQATYSLVELW